MKTIGIAGGSGFVGLHLAGLLEQAGYEVIIFSRSARPPKGGIRYARWDPAAGYIDTAALSSISAMVNLAGAGVVDKRWTAAYRQEILSSRTDAGRFLIGRLRAEAPGCTTYIAASATGIYGPDRPGLVPFTEQAPPYHDFLAGVCTAWEATSMLAADAYRTVVFRLGIVLGREGGAYKALSGPQQYGIKPVIGGGRQVVSWIHVADVAQMIRYALEQPALEGVYNAVAPGPVTHRALMDAIGQAKGGVKIPVPVPGLLLQLLLGDSSVEVLKSCTVSAGRIEAAGYCFRYPDIRSAVADLEQPAYSL